MRLTQIDESINDKGILKAMFFAGLPGAGKSTVAQRITDGMVSPRIVNTDKSFEFLAKKHGQEANTALWALIGPASKAMNSNMLVNYLNGVLPIFVDGTSANPNAAIRRAGIAESLGYDTMMVWVDVDYETAMERILKRERKTDPEFVDYVYKTLKGNKTLYQSKFGSNFIEVDNNSDNFDEMEGKVYNQASRFFTNPVENTIGQRLVERMEDQGDSYLVPNIYSQEYLEKLVGVWYMK